MSEWVDARVEAWYKDLEVSFPKDFPSVQLAKDLKHMSLSEVHALFLEEEAFQDFCDYVFFKDSRCVDWFRARLKLFVESAQDSTEYVIGKNVQELAVLARGCSNFNMQRSKNEFLRGFSRKKSFEFECVKACVAMKGSMDCVCALDHDVHVLKPDDVERLASRFAKILNSFVSSQQVNHGFNVVMSSSTNSLLAFKVARLLKVALPAFCQVLCFGFGTCWKISEEEVSIFFNVASGRAGPDGGSNYIWVDLTGRLVRKVPDKEEDVGGFDHLLRSTELDRTSAALPLELLGLSPGVVRIRGAKDQESGIIALSGTMFWMIDKVVHDADTFVEVHRSEELLQVKIPEHLWQRMVAEEKKAISFTVHCVDNTVRSYTVQYDKMVITRASPTQRKSHFSSASPERIVEHAFMLCTALGLRDDHDLGNEMTVGSLKNILSTLLASVPLDALLFAKDVCETKQQKAWRHSKLLTLSKASECLARYRDMSDMQDPDLGKSLDIVWERKTLPLPDFSPDRLDVEWDPELGPLYGRCIGVFLEFPVSFEPRNGWKSKMSGGEKFWNFWRQMAFWTSEWKMHYHVQAKARNKVHSDESSKAYAINMSHLLSLLHTHVELSAIPSQAWCREVESEAMDLRQCGINFKDHPSTDFLRENFKDEAVSLMECWFSLCCEVARLREIVQFFVCVGVVGPSKMGKSTLAEKCFGVKFDGTDGISVTTEVQCLRVGSLHVVNTPGSDDQDERIQERLRSALLAMDFVVLVVKFGAVLKKATTDLLERLQRFQKRVIVLVTHCDQMTDLDFSKRDELRSDLLRNQHKDVQVFFSYVRTRQDVASFPDAGLKKLTRQRVDDGMLLVEHVRGLVIKGLLELGLRAEDVLNCWQGLEYEGVEVRGAHSVLTADVSRANDEGFTARFYKRGICALNAANLTAASFWFLSGAQAKDSKAEAALLAIDNDGLVLNIAKRIHDKPELKTYWESLKEKLSPMPPMSIAKLLQEKRKVVGKGGGGEVWECQTSAQESVAVKVLSQSMDRKAEHPEVQAMWSEIAILRLMDHPNIVRCLGHSYKDLAIVMEFAEEGSLADLLYKRKQCAITTQLAVKLCLQIASGLEYLHDKGIVHRDVKAANVLVFKGMILKLTDFGLTRVIEDFRYTAAAGTASHQAPETFDGMFVRQSDIYAFVMTCWEVFARKWPFTDLIEGKKNQNFHNVVMKAVCDERKRPGISVFPTHWQPMAKVGWDHDPAKRPEVRVLAEAMAECPETSEEDRARWIPSCTTNRRDELK